MKKLRKAEPQPAADPLLADTDTPDELPEDLRNESYLDASPLRLAWRSFCKHKLAVIGLIVLALIYLVAIFADFLAPKPATYFDPDYTYAPPQRIHFLTADEDGGTSFGPYVFGYSLEVDPDTYEITLTVDDEVIVPLGVFVRGHEYRILGLIPMDRHLFGPVDPDAPAYFLGADRIGRDLLSRIIYGTRVSMTVGLVGVTFAFLLGVTLGGISGYFGGPVDLFIQRVIEFFMSIPLSHCGWDWRRPYPRDGARWNAISPLP